MWSVGTLVDVSIGGVFYRTNRIFKDKLQLQFRITNLVDGILVMVSGNIVRIMDDAPYGSSVGVEFTMPGSSPEIKRLCDHLMQMQPETQIPSNRQQMATTFDVKKALTLGRTLLDSLQFMNYYQLMGLTNSASTAQLVEMRNTMITELSMPQEGMLVADRKTLTDALALVQQITDILCNPHKRLAYDLSQGQVDPFVVRSLAHDYQIDIRPFTALWQQKHTDRIRKAALLWQDSRADQLAERLDAARDKARQAMDLDPFNLAYSINF